MFMSLLEGGEQEVVIEEEDLEPIKKKQKMIL